MNQYDETQIESPATPIHPAPNEELNIETQLPQGKLVSSNIDLNPDLDIENASHDEILRDNSQESLSLENKVSIPFSDSYESFRDGFFNHENNTVLSESQQSKFINYLDEQLLHIQRMFIKQQSEIEFNKVTYSFTQLILDLNKVLDLLYVSINQHSRLFGQVSYYIKILGDFEDYLNYYTIPIDNSSGISILFNFLHKIDLHLSFLIDGFEIKELNRIEKVSMTELTRLLPIISRLRIKIIEKIDNQRKLKKRRGSIDNETIENILELEISNIFQGLLDRESDMSSNFQ